MSFALLNAGKVWENGAKMAGASGNLGRIYRLRKEGRSTVGVTNRLNSISSLCRCGSRAPR